jgi:hypothetical protein
VERADQLARLRELRVERRRHLEGVGHVRVVVDHVRLAARLAGIETPRRARLRPQVQRHQRVELAGVRDDRDRTEDPVGLIHASPVVRLDALEIHRHELGGGELTSDDRLLDLGDRRLLEVKRARPERSDDGVRLCRCLGGDDGRRGGRRGFPDRFWRAAVAARCHGHDAQHDPFRFGQSFGNG